MPILLRKLDKERSEKIAQKLSKLVAEHIDQKKSTENFEQELIAIRKAINNYSKKHENLAKRILEILDEKYQIDLKNQK